MVIEETKDLDMLDNGLAYTVVVDTKEVKDHLFDWISKAEKTEDVNLDIVKLIKEDLTGIHGSSNYLYSCSYFKLRFIAEKLNSSLKDFAGSQRDWVIKKFFAFLGKDVNERYHLKGSNKFAPDQLFLAFIPENEVSSDLSLRTIHNFYENRIFDHYDVDYIKWFDELIDDRLSKGGSR